METNIQHTKPLRYFFSQLSTFNFQLLLLTILSTFNFQLSTHAQETPFPTDHLQLWLRADSVQLTDGKVSRWYDLSPNNYVIRQTSANARPTISDSAINNYPSLQFNGSSIYLTGGDILDLGNDSWTWFVIGKTNANAWNRPYLTKTLYGPEVGRYSLSSRNLMYITTNNIEYNVSIPTSAIQTSEWHMLVWENNKTTLKNNIYINGMLQGSSSFPSYNMQNSRSFLIGAYNGSNGSTPQTDFYLNGEIAEIIAFNNIDNTIQASVYHYLAERYFPTYLEPSVSLGLDIHVPYGYCDTAITTAYNPDFTSYIWNTGETDSIIHVNHTGRYSVTVTNSFGVTSTDDINVYFPEVHQMQDTTICSGDTIYWNTGLSSEDYTFQWFMDSTPTTLKSQSPLNANQSNSPLLALQPLKALPSSSSLPIHSPGSYYCIITDSLGCTNP